MLPAPVQEASLEQADVAARLAAAALPGDPAGWHRLTWLGQVLPLLAGRLGEVAGKAAPGAEAVQALQQLAQRIESEQVRQGRAGPEHCTGHSCPLYRPQLASVLTEAEASRSSSIGSPSCCFDSPPGLHAVPWLCARRLLGACV